MERTAGFSLIEIQIAFLVLLLAIVPIVGMFSTAGKQSKQTGQYTLAVTIEEKVAEEFRLENWENVHQIEQLVARPTVLEAAPVVDGHSEAFKVIEDSAEPLGLIRPGEDAAITIAQPTLHKNLERYRVAANGRFRQGLPAGRVFDLSLEVEWTDYRDVRLKLPALVSLGQHGCATSPPSVIANRAAADEAIRQALYPAATGTLTQAAGAVGADPKAARNVGDLFLLTRWVREGESGHRTGLARARSALGAASDAASRSRALMALARTYEKRAVACLEVLMAMDGPLADLAGTFQPGQLGSASWPQVRQVLRTQLTSVLYGFQTNLYWSKRWYRTAMTDPSAESLRPRQARRLLMKQIDMWKLEALTQNPAALDRLRRTLEHFRGLEDGRNPNFFRYADFELAHCTDRVRLGEAYPLASRYRWYENFRTHLASFLARM